MYSVRKGEDGRYNVRKGKDGRYSRRECIA